MSLPQTAPHLIQNKSQGHGKPYKFYRTSSQVTCDLYHPLCLAHPIPLALASFLLLRQSWAHALLRTFALHVSSVWNILSPDNHMAHSLAAFKSFPKSNHIISARFHSDTYLKLYPYSYLPFLISLIMIYFFFVPWHFSFPNISHNLFIFHGSCLFSVLTSILH